MKNEIKEEFDEAVDIREELNSVHWKEYEDLATVFAALFNEPKRTLKFISDLNYYKGGYPSESSPPRIDALFERIGTAARYFSLIGRIDELNAILERDGFKLVRTDKPDSISMDHTRIDDNKRATKAYEDLQLVIADVSGDPKDVVEMFLDRTLALQGTICRMADQIKIDLYEKANEKVPSLGKSGFVTAVNTVANKRIKDRKRKDSEKLVDRALEKSETLRADADLIEESIIDAQKESLS